MSKLQKILIGALSVTLVAVLAIGGTLAFLTDSDDETNVFAVGDLDIELDEPNWDPEKGTDLGPGKTLMKDPVVTAVENESYMRVYMDIIDDNATIPNPEYVDEATTPGVPTEIENENFGKIITDQARLALIAQTVYYDPSFDAENAAGALDTTKMYSVAQLAAMTSLTNGVNSAFVKDEDRSDDGSTCYVYNGKFSEGSTATLFTNIVVPTDWNQTHMATLGKYKIVIRAQAIQTAGFADADEAFTALDKEVADKTLQKK